MIADWSVDLFTKLIPEGFQFPVESASSVPDPRMLAFTLFVSMGP